MLECRPSQTDCISRNRARTMETSSSLSVIILNWNAATDTIRCVRSFAGWQQIRPTIWVVDNASENGSADLIAQACPETTLCLQIKTFYTTSHYIAPLLVALSFCRNQARTLTF